MPLNPSPELVFADGPGSNPHHPYKSDIRRIFRQVEQIIDAFTSNGGIIYASKSALEADLARPTNAMAWVLGDAVAANNGIYRKVGASGAGSWVRAGDLPYSFILASNTGEGTPSAIQATTSIPVSGSALILLQIAEDFAGSAATVSFNGGSALVIKTNSGADVSRLAAGSVVYGVISGPNFRLANDEAIATLIYEARDEAIAAADRSEAEADRSRDEADRSEDARDIAAGYASDAVSQGEVPIYSTFDGMSSLSLPSGLAGLVVNGRSAVGDGGRAFFRRAADADEYASFVPGLKFTSADGSQFVWADTTLNVGMIDASGSATAFQTAIESVPAGESVEIHVPAGNYVLDTSPVLAGRVVSWSVDARATFTGSGRLPVEGTNSYFDFKTDCLRLAHVVGTYGAPVRTDSPVAYFRKVGGPVDSQILNPTVAVTARREEDEGYGNAVSALFVEVVDCIGNPIGAAPGNVLGFIEAARIHAYAVNPAVDALVYGAIIGAGSEEGVSLRIMTAAEFDVANRDADAPSLKGWYETGGKFILSVNATSSGSKKILAYYGTNASDWVPDFARARAGFAVLGAVDEAGFAISTPLPIPVGLDFRYSSLTYAAIALPNGSSIRWQNAAKTDDLSIMFVDPFDNLVFGQGLSASSSRILMKIYDQVTGGQSLRKLEVDNNNFLKGLPL